MIMLCLHFLTCSVIINFVSRVICFTLMPTSLYRVIQEELLPLMELISEDILSKKCHITWTDRELVHIVYTFKM
jgi:hypothetical protein